MNKMQINDPVKKAFMDSMESEFKREFGYDLKTIMFFAGAVCDIRKQNNENIEQIKKERDKYKDRYEKLKDMICRWDFTDLECYLDDWGREDSIEK